MMGLVGTERVSLYACQGAQTAPRRHPPTVGRAGLQKLFSFIEGIEGGGDAALETAIESVLKVHVGRGIAVVLSDFLTFGDLRRAMNGLYSAGLETFAVQILGPGELAPELAGDTRLVDSETGDTLDVSSATDLLALYQEYRAAYQRNLEMLCQQRSGRFMTVSATEPIESILFDHMRRAGWVQ
jgi:hypothetical protein